VTVGARLHVSLCVAATVVAEVLRGRSLGTALERAGDTGMESPRAALVDLTHGTLRCYGRLQAITRALARKNGALDPLVEALLWCALYALWSGRYAPYTVVDQAVRACIGLDRHAAKGFVNGMLRSYQRESTALDARFAQDAEYRWQHPGWWIEAVRTAWPDDWESVLAAGNQHPPMTLRVNRRRISPDAYLAKLGAAGIGVSEASEQAVRLERALPVDRLPGFSEGEVSVQDAGAQRAAPWLDLASGMRVLDACAAPGGKCAHLLECEDVVLTALDIDAQRCRLIESNLSRLGLSAEVRCADARQPEDWWDGTPYERILADVPCSGSGVARRHPDMKWLRRESDLRAFAQRQAGILDALWRALAPGGKLLYVTCSVFPEENDAVLDAFCQRTPAARRLSLPAGAAPQLLPGLGHDGFYYALLGRSG
jgi:16S rRNA (cytosine967-C5)-methyltransferase